MASVGSTNLVLYNRKMDTDRAQLFENRFHLWNGYCVLHTVQSSTTHALQLSEGLLFQLMMALRVRDGKVILQSGGVGIQSCSL